MLCCQVEQISVKGSEGATDDVFFVLYWWYISTAGAEGIQLLKYSRRNLEVLLLKCESRKDEGVR